ncbi:hypothetical protein JL720_5237 [Aureococcus anophagefferens]|nr:hypothetical protein JL720_5237 [Aureococcus anophagefferens]
MHRLALLLAVARPCGALRVASRRAFGAAAAAAFDPAAARGGEVDDALRSFNGGDYEASLRQRRWSSRRGGEAPLANLVARDRTSSTAARCSRRSASSAATARAPRRAALCVPTVTSPNGAAAAEPASAVDWCELYSTVDVVVGRWTPRTLDACALPREPREARVAADTRPFQRF